MKNSFDLLKRGTIGEPQRYLAQWNDDMHHVLTYLVTGEGARTGYDKLDADPYADLEKALANGFVHDPTEGEGSGGRTRGVERLTSRPTASSRMCKIITRSETVLTVNGLPNA